MVIMLAGLQGIPTDHEAVLVMFATLQRYFVSGLTAGSVK